MSKKRDEANIVYECKACGQEFSTANGLIAHQISDHGVEL